MPRVGKILLEMFGEESLKRARERNNIFELWPEIIREVFDGDNKNNSNQIDKLIENSHLGTIANNKIIVETNHTGWLQILQMKKRELLNIIQARFNDVQIDEIDFILKSQQN
jgi:hypothetical protein